MPAAAQAESVVHRQHEAPRTDVPLRAAWYRFFAAAVAAQSGSGLAILGGRRCAWHDIGSRDFRRRFAA